MDPNGSDKLYTGTISPIHIKVFEVDFCPYVVMYILAINLVHGTFKKGCLYFCCKPLNHDRLKEGLVNYDNRKKMVNTFSFGCLQIYQNKEPHIFSDKIPNEKVFTIFSECHC